MSNNKYWGEYTREQNTSLSLLKLELKSTPQYPLRLVMQLRDEGQVVIEKLQPNSVNVL